MFSICFFQMLDEAEELRGWLQKRGDKGLIKGFKSRYFQQIDSKLYYFEDPADKEPLGNIDLSSCSIGKGNSFNLPNSSETQGQQLSGGYAFSINTPLRQWQLLANTQKDYEVR